MAQTRHHFSDNKRHILTTIKIRNCPSDFKRGQHCPMASREDLVRLQCEMSSLSNFRSFLAASLENPSSVIDSQFTNRMQRR
ncbi:hypothetical protein MTR_5g097215 [Medicago truncatula]|uniref:Uncharacterized protein n=1 Tax=Medicago truncatula TaxID=3880 RepID=A0A072UH89_MEDTR|nr:hypothetical protein MTR_5g097215 [Medicago truncatula]